MYKYQVLSVRFQHIQIRVGQLSTPKNHQTVPSIPVSLEERKFFLLITVTSIKCDPVATSP